MQPELTPPQAAEPEAAEPEVGAAEPEPEAAEPEVGAATVLERVQTSAVRARPTSEFSSCEILIARATFICRHKDLFVGQLESQLGDNVLATQIA